MQNETLKLTVFELDVKVYLLKNLQVDDMPEALAKLIDSSMAEDEKLKAWHEENHSRPYTFNGLFPLETDRIYKEGCVYTMQIRTVDQKLAKHFRQVMCNFYNAGFKVLTVIAKTIPQRQIDKIYSITPVILRHKEIAGYWKTQISLEEYENMLFQNTMKKYNEFMGEKQNEDFQLYQSITFLNQKPCKLKLKGITLLGDKLELQIAQNQQAQQIAYFLTGVGLGEISARGASYVNFKWLK